jgi:hypothetical protein
VLGSTGGALNEVSPPRGSAVMRPDHAQPGVEIPDRGFFVSRAAVARSAGARRDQVDVTYTDPVRGRNERIDYGLLSASRSDTAPLRVYPLIGHAKCGTEVPTASARAPSGRRAAFWNHTASRARRAG